jgi:hypothetical protein
MFVLVSSFILLPVSLSRNVVQQHITLAATYFQQIALFEFRRGVCHRLPNT